MYGCNAICISFVLYSLWNNDLISVPSTNCHRHFILIKYIIPK